MTLTRSLAGLSVLLILLTSCSGSNPTVVPTGWPTSGGAAGTAVASPTVPSTPGQASPVIPTSGYLSIGGERAVAVEVPDPALAASYAVTKDALYRSDAAGAWHQTGGWDATRTLLVDPADPNVLYRGGHPACAVGGAAVTLQKSEDGGKTWQTLDAGQNVRPMIVDPSNPRVIFGERCTLAISVDGGQTWTNYPMTLSFDVSDMSLAGKDLYVLATSEGGTSRIRLIDVADPGHPVMGTDLHEFWGGGAVRASTGRLIVGEPHGIDISADGGQTWSFSRSGLEGVTVSVDPLVEPVPNQEISRKFGIYCLAVDPRDATRIFAGTIRGLYQSQDAGKTWSRVTQVDEVPVRELAFGQNGSRLYVTTDDGVFVLRNP